MAESDPWLGVAWKVYAAQGERAPYLKPSDKEGAFTLTAVPDPVSGTTAYYRVNFLDGDMPPCWRGLLLYPRGDQAVAPPSPLLQPWTPSGDAPWLAAADSVRDGLNAATARLVGDLYPQTNAEALTLVGVSQATTQGLPLLVMNLTSSASSESALSDSPTAGPTGGAHGDN